MEKHSQLVKDLQAAADELEVLALEGEIIDLDIVEGLIARFEKLKKAITQKQSKV